VHFLARFMSNVHTHPPEEIMKRTLISTLIATLFALPAVAQAEEAKTAMADSTESDSAATEELVSPDEDDADAEDGDDILQIISLPLATGELRESGVEEEEIQEALAGAEEVGLSAGETSEILIEEHETNKKRGIKKGFGRYVRGLIADGYRGKELRKKIRERKDEVADLTPEEEKKVKAKLAKARDKELKRKKKRRAKIAKLKKAGKKVKIRSKKRHMQLKAKRKVEHKRHKAKMKKLRRA